MKLVAIQPFDAYKVGAEITDAAEVQSILESDKSSFVTKVASEPVPEKKPKG